MGDNVRVEMARARVSQTALANRVSLSQQALSRRLLGHVSFTVDELARIAAALGVDVHTLIGDVTAERGASA